jgi:hypothetical protein
MPLINEDGTPSDQFMFWLRLMTGKAQIIGTGSPEGVIAADQGATYMDDTGTAGAILYVKRDADIAGDVTTGWILV